MHSKWQFKKIQVIIIVLLVKNNCSLIVILILHRSIIKIIQLIYVGNFKNFDWIYFCSSVY